VRDELAPWLKGNVKPGWRLRFFLMNGIKPQAFLNDLRKVLNEHGVLNEPLGLDMPIVVADFANMLRQEGFNVIDGCHSLYRARSIKTQDEIQCLRIANAITDEIYEAMRKEIRPGVRECDLAAIAADISLRRVCDGPVEIGCCSGRNTNPNMMGYSAKPIRPREMIYSVVAGVSWRGYKSAVYRDFTCGKASDRQKELYAECRSLLYEAIFQVRAGITTADICKAWPGPEHWGVKTWWDISDCALGNGVGLDIQEAPIITPLFSPENPITLEENMVVAIQTFYGSKLGEKPIQGARLENDVLVTKDGYEILNMWPDEEITECWI
jgi:Xaa-Pro dipeptidase